MSSRSMVVLAVLAAILVVIAITSRRAERAEETLATGPIFPQADWEAVTTITLAADGDTVRLERPQDRWRVATEGGFPADTTLVARMLEKTELFDRRHLRSRAPEMQAKFEVDAGSGIAVQMYAAGGDPVARFRIGKTGPDFRSQYLRPFERNEVYLIPDYLRSAFDVSRSTWRDRRIFDFDAEKVAQVRFETAAGPPIVVARNATGTLRMVAPESTAVKEPVIQSTLRMLGTLRADAFPDSIPPLDAIGLAEPQQRVAVTLEDGAQYALELGIADSAAAQTYAKRAADETLYFLRTSRLSSLLRGADELRDDAGAGAPAPGAPPPGLPPGVTLPPGE